MVAEEEEGEETIVVVGGTVTTTIIQVIISQSQSKSQRLNTTVVTGMAIINQNAELNRTAMVDGSLIFKKMKKRYLCEWPIKRKKKRRKNISRISNT